MSDSDVTVVTINATAVKDALQNLNSTNASANATAAPADSTAPAAAGADSADAAPAKKGVPMLFWIWGGFSIWTYFSAAMTWNGYNSFATTLNKYKLAGNTAWTTSYIKGKNPISQWMITASSVMTFQFISIIGWILGIAKMKKPFLLMFKIAQLFPVIELILWLAVYFSYTACDSTALKATQFDGTTTTVTQIVSCKNSQKSTATKAQFGTTGTWAPYVSQDPYNTWFFTNTLTALGLIGVGGAAFGPVTSYFGGNGSNSSNATNATAPAAAPAAANATAPAADNATAADDSSAATGDDSTADSGSGKSVDVTINVNKDDGNGDDWNTPAEPAQPAEKQNCGFWGCL